MSRSKISAVAWLTWRMWRSRSRNTSTRTKTRTHFSSAVKIANLNFNPLKDGWMITSKWRKTWRIAAPFDRPSISCCCRMTRHASSVSRIVTISVRARWEEKIVAVHCVSYHVSRTWVDNACVGWSLCDMYMGTYLISEFNLMFSTMQELPGLTCDCIRYDDVIVYAIHVPSNCLRKNIQ